MKTTSKFVSEYQYLLLEAIAVHSQDSESPYASKLNAGLYSLWLSMSNDDKREIAKLTNRLSA